MRKKELPDIEPVILPERLGMRPGLYITILAALCLIAIFFCLFILPGVLSDASYVAFDLKGAGIAIYEDGRYLGSSEGSIYRSTAGDHTYEFFIGDEKIGESREHNPKRIFFSLFHKTIKTISPELDPTDETINYILSSFYKDAALWSKLYEHEEKFHIPPFYTELAENAVAFSIPENAVEKAMIYGAMHITSKELYDDFANAVDFLSARGIDIDLSKYTKILDDLFLGKGISGERMKSSNSYSGILNGTMFSYTEYDDVVMGNSMSSSTYPDTNTYPVSAHTASFSIASRAVTEYEYALFVEENPKWAKSNKDQLIEDGLVDSGYLDGITLSTKLQSQRPIRAISYYAAEAYTEWLSIKDGKNYTLPTEAEWYVAEESVPGKKYYNSLIAIDKSDNYPIGMLGQLWEFTCTEYIPLARIFDYSYSAPYGYDDIIVKGGSYITSGITGEDVGVISKSETSEYVGFRVVMHE